MATTHAAVELQNEAHAADLLDGFTIMDHRKNPGNRNNMFCYLEKIKVARLIYYYGS